MASPYAAIRRAEAIGSDYKFTGDGKVIAEKDLTLAETAIGRCYAYGAINQDDKLLMEKFADILREGSLGPSPLPKVSNLDGGAKGAVKDHTADRRAYFHMLSRTILKELREQVSRQHYDMVLNILRYDRDPEWLRRPGNQFEQGKKVLRGALNVLKELVDA